MYRIANELECPECDKTIESTDDLERAEGITEVETDGGSVNPYRDETGDLFLCSGCKRPLGFERHD